MLCCLAWSESSFKNPCVSMLCCLAWNVSRMFGMSWLRRSLVLGDYASHLFFQRKVQQWNTRIFTGRFILSKNNTAMKHKDFYREIHFKQDNTALEHKDFYRKIHFKQDNTALKHKDFYRKIHSKQDNTALEHKDFYRKIHSNQCNTVLKYRYFYRKSFQARQHSMEK